MEINIYGPNFELIYENGLLLINYCYQGFLYLTTLINI